jgi:hypothetical protein
MVLQTRKQLELAQIAGVPGRAGAINSCDGYAGARQLPYTGCERVGICANSSRNRRRLSSERPSFAAGGIDLSATIAPL